ncbi:hypothetical protein [Streptomyces sp. NBC_00385]|uniref:hypothetical protein n=1 Tax=Streptomyces sp. NBC_00385 TaxID=2975733 RepID=UPI002DDC5166|nr:hypothetical protein [Streptomyces sp. NBC_00385]WRZ05055.1 hypothetical protein OG959_17705 [Streptomyces sp. NBC_00385]
MRCDEPLSRPGEDYSYRDCPLELGHPGDHDYFGERFPRPEATDGLDPEIADLIEAAARKRGIWDLDERQWPIVVEVTSVYVIKAPGETEDEALAYWADSGEYPDLDGEQAIDGGFEIRRADRYQRDSLTGAPIGPVIACPGCGRQAMRREWFHDPYRKCHGPIDWRENPHARTPQYRYSREHNATPVTQAVAV